MPANCVRGERKCERRGQGYDSQLWPLRAADQLAELGERRHGRREAHQRSAGAHLSQRRRRQAPTHPPQDRRDNGQPRRQIVPVIAGSGWRGRFCHLLRPRKVDRGEAGEERRRDPRLPGRPGPEPRLRGRRTPRRRKPGETHGVVIARVMEDSPAAGSAGWPRLCALHSRQRNSAKRRICRQYSRFLSTRPSQCL